MAIFDTLIAPYQVEKGGFAVDDPANGDVIARIHSYSVEETEAAIARADVAQKSWAQKTAKERAGVLRTWFNLIMEQQEALAQLVTAECGKPIAEARGEVAYAASFVEWFAEEAKRAYGETIPTHKKDARIVTFKQPVGVVSAITPWNFPVAMITRKAAPALAAGCAMIVKPAEATPLSALALEKLAIEAGIPADLFKIVTSNKASDIGKVLSTHPTIRKISFTGSTGVGKILMRQSADTVKRVSMELGGNAPFIVFDDADLDAAVQGAVASKYRNAGQTCVCANRFLVQAGIYDRFVEAFSAKVAALSVGAGASGADVGPLIDDGAVEKVESLLKSALDAGATATIGGKRSEKGPRFFEPTVLSGVTADMDIASEEIFGPIATIFRFENETEAIRLANDTPYGLAAYFYARDIGRVWRVAEALEYGMVGINEGILSTEVAPFGGIKESGVGREGAYQGLDEYLEVKYCLMGGI